jgi:SAM-dependent methyltransferase
MKWEKLGDWWLEELAGDPAYVEEIEPLLVDLLGPARGQVYLDVGCGDGRTMAVLVNARGRVVGCDLNQGLLLRAREHGPVVRARLPDLSWIRPGSLDGALVGLVLEHLADEVQFFSQVGQAVRQSGVLAVVINHPIWTAPNSSPIEDAGGETLWRPGTYFGRGYSDEPAGRQKVRFFHRTLSDLLNAASVGGWDLQRLVESGVSPSQVERVPEYSGQEHLPRILGVRWLRR